jgi:nitrilase
MTEKNLFVAAVQASPVFLKKKETVDKACDLIATAGRNGAKMMVFPEAYIPGYPDWVWVVPGNKKSIYNELYHQLLENAVVVPDEATHKLCQVAKQSKSFVVMGVNERNSEASNASLYNTILYIDPSGDIIGKHRKLIPTANERLMWAQGDGSTLSAYDTSIGKIGGLICWENYMPLARHAMYAWGVQIYVAPTWDSSENWLISLRHIAKEGGMFVIGVCSAIKIGEIPDKHEFKEFYPEGKEWVNVGNSCIINPQSEFIAGPSSKKEEILYAEIDFQQISTAKWIFDAAGHYARPDVFQFTLNQKPNKMLESDGADS